MKPFKYIIVLFIGVTSALYSQSNSDQLFLASGETLNVVVKKVVPKTITYVFVGEEMENIVEKEAVLKIVFKNGREQFFNKPSTTTRKIAIGYPALNANEGAILPFDFIFDGVATKEEGIEAQQYYYKSVMKRPERNSITYQDPEITQRRLRKAGITDPEQYQDYEITEIAKILGVGIVVTGKITVDYRSTSTNSYGSSTVKVNEKKKKARAYSSDYSTSTDEFDTKVLFRIYDKNGKKVVDVTRRPFMATTRNNYVTALSYLMKRTPYYHKK